jgi:galactokinase/mevalonate kinase-like predicted kinase
LLGAGGGGCFLFAVDPERRANVLAALPGLVEIPLGIDQDGARVMVYEPNGLSR